MSDTLHVTITERQGVVVERTELAVDAVVYD